ncbi:hypothetical protein [Okeania sp.]|nr:hypothetical protein [Okeania sp.]MEB3343079.1 hypothetical protein [Okeania sp.]
MVITHMNNYDFPETESTIINQAKSAGFSKFEFIYRDQKHPGYLLVCYK